MTKDKDKGSNSSLAFFRILLFFCIHDDWRPMPRLSQKRNDAKVHNKYPVVPDKVSYKENCKEAKST